MSDIIFGRLVEGRIVDGPVVKGKLMKAAVFRGPEDIGVEDVPIPEVGREEVLIKVGASSICGSDIHSYHGGPGAQYPRIPGHEIAGVISKVGEGVEDVKIGMRVSPDDDIYTCGKCEYCLVDRSNLCASRRGIGSFGAPGGFAEYVKVPIVSGCVNLHEIPENIPFEHACVAQTIACGYHGVVDLGKVKAEDFVTIIGAGPIGLSVLAVAKAFGAKVLISDVLPYTLEAAEKMGADYVIDASKKDLKKEVMDLTSGCGANKVFECVGGNQVKTIVQAIELVKTAGRFVCIGIFTNQPRELQLPITWWQTVQRKEIECSSTRGSNRRIGTSLKLMSEGKINVGPMVTHILPLKDVKRGFELMDKKLENALKVVLKPNIS